MRKVFPDSLSGGRHLSYKSLELFIDGASHGNPGEAGVGVIICHKGEVVKNFSKAIGTATNNVAEYYALIYGLQEALILKASDITVNTDSELLAKQLNRDYKVKNAAIKPLYEQAGHLLEAFSSAEIRHIPREQNRGADKLATQAVRYKDKPKWSLRRKAGEESPSSKGLRNG
jgi:ribonuclease HI